MLTFGTFFTIITKYMKSGGELNEPDLFQRFIRLQDDRFKQDCSHTSSYATTLRGYKNGTRTCTSGSDYYPLNISIFQSSFIHKAKTDKTVLQGVADIVDKYFSIPSYQLESMVKDLIYVIEYDETIEGNTKFLNKNKKTILSEKHIALDEFLLELWCYVVKHGDLDDKNQKESVDRGCMNYDIKVYMHELEMEDSEKDEFDDDEFFSSTKTSDSKIVNVKVEKIEINGNNNNVAGYAEYQIQNGGKEPKE